MQETMSALNLTTCIFDTVWPRSGMTIRHKVESTKRKNAHK